MARTIVQLIEAIAAGDTITQADADQLSRHIRRSNRVGAVLAPEAVPDDYEETGNEFREFRAQTLREMRGFTTPDEYRQLVRELFSVMEILVELAAGQKGMERRPKKGPRAGGRQRAVDRQKAVSDLVVEFDQLRAKYADTDLSQRAVALKLAKKKTNPKKWNKLTAEKQMRAASNLQRRIQNERKKQATQAKLTSPNQRS